MCRNRVLLDAGQSQIGVTKRRDSKVLQNGEVTDVGARVFKRWTENVVLPVVSCVRSISTRNLRTGCTQSIEI